jgi:hypothetical protein
MSGEPFSHYRMFMGGVVVEDRMNVRLSLGNNASRILSGR